MSPSNKLTTMQVKRMLENTSKSGWWDTYERNFEFHYVHVCAHSVRTVKKECKSCSSISHIFQPSHHQEQSRKNTSWTPTRRKKWEQTSTTYQKNHIHRVSPKKSFKCTSNFPHFTSHRTSPPSLWATWRELPRWTGFRSLHSHGSPAIRWEF